MFVMLRVRLMVTAFHGGESFPVSMAWALGSQKERNRLAGHNSWLRQKTDVWAGNSLRIVNFFFLHFSQGRGSPTWSLPRAHPLRSTYKSSPVLYRDSTKPLQSCVRDLSKTYPSTHAACLYQHLVNAPGSSCPAMLQKTKHRYIRSTSQKEKEKLGTQT